MRFCGRQRKNALWNSYPLSVMVPQSVRKLTASSTRQPGIVTLTDLTPTVLALYGVPPPPHMEGRSLL